MTGSEHADGTIQRPRGRPARDGTGYRTIAKTALASTVLILLLTAAGPTAAANGSIDTQPPQSWRYSFADIGYFGGRTDEGLRGSDSGIAIGGGAGFRFNRHLAFEFDALYSGRQYETPPGYEFADDEMLLTNLMFTGNVQAVIPFWLFEGYAGIGLGLIFSELEVPSTVVPLAAAVTRSSIDFSTQLLIGVDFVFTQRGRIGIEFRNNFARASFGDLSNGSVDIGGKLIMIKIKLPL